METLRNRKVWMVLAILIAILLFGAFNTVHRAGATYQCLSECEITPSITPEITEEVTPTQEPEVTPTQEPEATPTEQPVVEQHQDVDDGLGCAHHDCNTHRDDVPTQVVPEGPPSTGFSPYDRQPVGWK